VGDRVRGGSREYVEESGGWNRIHFVTGDIEAEVVRLRDGGVRFRNDIVTGPSGSRSSSRTRRETRSSCSSPPATDG